MAHHGAGGPGGDGEEERMNDSSHDEDRSIESERAYDKMTDEIVDLRSRLAESEAQCAAMRACLEKIKSITRCFNHPEMCTYDDCANCNACSALNRFDAGRHLLEFARVAYAALRSFATVERALLLAKKAGIQ